MKTHKLFLLAAVGGFVLSPLIASAGDEIVTGKLTVTGNTDLDGSSLQLGTITGGAFGLEVFYYDSTTLSQILFRAQRTEGEWIFGRVNAITPADTDPVMRLDSSNKLNLYNTTEGIPVVVIDPDGMKITINGFEVITAGADWGDRPLELGNGTATGIHATAMGGSGANGYSSTAMGWSSAVGDYSTGMGNSQANGNSATAMGSGFADGDFATAMGYGYADGDYATAMGDSTASGNYATAMGDGSDAIGVGSTAMGIGSVADGEGSVAMGVVSHAYGQSSTAMGWYSDAFGYASVAMGNASFTGGYGSTAMGWYSTAYGDLSTAIGNWTNAQGYNQFVVGRFNIPQGSPSEWDPADELFTIGNGEDSSNPSNAFVVYKDGKVIIPKAQGDILMGEFGNPAP